MEAVEVESKGSHRGEGDRGTSRNDRRSTWGCTLLLVNNCLQNISFFGLSTNLVNYFQVELHAGSKSAANSVTNWMGTSSITPLAAAFLADSFLGRYWTISLFLVISVAGYGVVTASASVALQSAVFYVGLYLVALGGALTPVMVSFGADQFGDDESERGQQSSFFNWFYFSLNVGSLVGGTVVVWVQTAHGWRLGYGIPALLSVLAVALYMAGTGAYRRHQPPGGFPATRIAQVVVAAVRKCDVEVPDDAAFLHECDGDDGVSTIQGSRRLVHTDQFRFFDKAAVETAGDKGVRPASPWRLCTVTQVEELKCVLRLLPVWACGIIFAAAYTQMSTTFILQGDTLDPRLGSFRVPAAVLSVFDTLSIIIWVPLYDCVVVPLARRLTGHNRGFTPLVRMGIGFVVLTITMLLAGVLEVARRRVLTRHGTYIDTNGTEYVPMSIFWQVPQYVVVGAAEVFTFIGQLEFFYEQAPDAMRSVCSGLASVAFALGNYASSALVVVVVRATARSGSPGWIPDDINDGHLDYFFWLLAVLCVGNFGAYLVVARWYNYKKTAD
ncbi:protein NRT1/ PTR FAMILY 8.2-like [Lolium rigidum]|uniref:protein NRT1/ PTR FAMILY 8.2-like n=1 Tax=Lolium rigidum TaxID=89674 RepID=UPI001F5DB28B|nr:protein NRT1/ PTR FAMILY 8.2-like [Lolium rigidum]